jgi:hypothetical protein
VTVGQRNPSCAGSCFHPLTNLTGRSHAPAQKPKTRADPTRSVCQPVGCRRKRRRNRKIDMHG